MKPTFPRLSLALVALLLGSSLLPAADFGYKGWGPRVGLSSDPDQLTGGVHIDFGEFASGVRFQPSVDLGFGDDVTTLTINGMVSYYFHKQVDGPVVPYAGGQLTVAFYDLDSDCEGFGQGFGNGECDSETEIGPMAVGGIEMGLEGGNRFLAELALGFSDLPEVKITAGWTF